MPIRSRRIPNKRLIYKTFSVAFKPASPYCPDDGPERVEL
jgi:hypothetical protein